MYDILIKNGTVIDGTGRRRFRADVAVSDGLIAQIGDLSLEDAHVIVDARDKFVTPGFIDVNNHSDAYWKIFTNPTLDSLILQGVTTVVGGNSGSSLAPLLQPEMIKSIQRWTNISQLNINWQTMAEFLQTVESRRLSLNFATLVGHSTLRRAMLHGEDRTLTSDEMDVVADALDRALSEGALGLSVALKYAHSRTATREELLKLAAVVKKHNALLVVYLSDEEEGLLDSLQAKMAIARESGVRLHISHLKAVGEKNHHLVDEALRMITDARNEGLDITCDIYPYTVMSAVLYTLLPHWATDGGRTRMLSRLRDKETRRRVIEEMKQNKNIDYGELIISICPIIKCLSHRRVADIAEDRGQSPEEVVVDILLAAGGHAVVLIDALGEKQVQNTIRADFSFIVSNGGGYNLADWSSGEVIHPRNFGAFARFLGRYVRDKDLLGWEKAIKKITSLPAGQYALEGRGSLETGMIADITVFDPDAIIDRATLENPYNYADGVHTVIVGGEIAAQNGKVVARNGEVIKKKR